MIIAPASNITELYNTHASAFALPQILDPVLDCGLFVGRAKLKVFLKQILKGIIHE